jgi:opacity protein-like surface antigen
VRFKRGTKLGSDHAAFSSKEIVMLRKTLFGTLTASLLLVGASAANAQFASPIRFNVNAGATLPVGSVGESLDAGGGGADLGFHLGAGLELRAPLMPIGLRFDGAYDRMGIEDVDASWSIWNLTANAVVSPMASPLYFIGGIGFYSWNITGEAVNDSDAETDFGFNLGAGLSLPLTGFSAFIEGRFHNINIDGDDIRFVPITFGLRF